MVDFEWYRSFISIYKHNSVSEAAKSRMMTQPAMSQHLASLEAEIGEALFTRTSRKMKPTEKGKELYTQVAPLIESLEEITMGFKASSSSTMPAVRIGSAPEFFREKILPNLDQINMKMIAHYGIASVILELLKEDKVDVIITSKKYQTPGIEHIKLMDEKFVIVASSTMEIPEIADLGSLEQWLSSQRWLSYGLELPIIRRFWREHLKKRPLLQPVHVLPDLHMILNSIENGDGMSLLPTYMLEKSIKSGTVKVVFSEYFVMNELYVAYKLKHKNDPLIKEIVDFIKSTC
ncbi:LysR family transcriptional regulator [Laceyella putida]|uniref:LysR family transcriptional regulator n=1 Tax=Laceyella putida TaxID=110101 RepID=A0ABW2RJ58_9BACL